MTMAHLEKLLAFAFIFPISLLLVFTFNVVDKGTCSFTLYI